jgi:hypothetical protein
VNVDTKTGAVLCAKCVARMSDAPAQPKPTVVVTADEKKARKEARAEKKATRLAALKNKKKGKGRGFHLKQLAEFEGDFYSFGKKITDAEVAKIRKKLKAKA